MKTQKILIDKFQNYYLCENMYDETGKYELWLAFRHGENKYIFVIKKLTMSAI